MHKEFEVHLLNPEGIAKANLLASIFDEALTKIETICLTADQSVNARQMAIVRTKFEEASFFAKKAVAVLPENQR